MTSQPDTVLAILTADCLPVVFAAIDGSEVGVAQAGWRGLAAGVLEATVAAMQTPPARLRAWLGPAAGPEHYEIGAEVRDAFVGKDEGAATCFVPTRPGHWRVDLFALARRRLADLGLTPEPAMPAAACTYFLGEVQWHPARSTRTARVFYGPDGVPVRLQLCASSDNNNTVLLQLPLERQQLVSAVRAEIELVERRLARAMDAAGGGG